MIQNDNVTADKTGQDDTCLLDISNDSTYNALLQFKHNHAKQLVFGHLNVNSVKNKFDEVCDLMQENCLDVCALSESKIDSSLPHAQFLIPNFTHYRADRTINGGGILCYVRSTIPHRSRTDIAINENNIESIVVEVKSKSYNCFIISMYRSPSVPISLLINTMQTIFDKCLLQSKYIYLMGDLNVNLLNKVNELSDLLNMYGLTNVIKGPTCFKSVSNPSLLDVIITNYPRSISGHINIDVGISDCHNLICASTKITAPEKSVTKITYRSYKNFNESDFLQDIISANIVLETNCNPSECLSKHIDEIQKVVDKHAPLKTKILNGKQAPYMNSELRKAINVKNMLRRKYYKYPTPDKWEKFRTQRNKVNSLKRKSMKQYFYDRCEGDKANKNGKQFWDTIKPFFYQ